MWRRSQQIEENQTVAVVVVVKVVVAVRDAVPSSSTRLRTFSGTYSDFVAAINCLLFVLFGLIYPEYFALQINLCRWTDSLVSVRRDFISFILSVANDRQSVDLSQEEKLGNVLISLQLPDPAFRIISSLLERIFENELTDEPMTFIVLTRTTWTNNDLIW